MTQPGDYGRGYPQERDPRRQPPATPPQWGAQPQPPYREEQRPVSPQAYRQPAAPSFAPAQPRHAPPPQPHYVQQPRQQWQQPAPRKKRRVFLWVFLAVQAVFIVWIITGLASHPAGPSTAAQAAQQCANGGWQGLFKSQADCNQHYAVALNDAGDVGKGIGAVLIIVIWMMTDFFLGLGYGIYRLAGRR